MLKLWLIASIVVIISNVSASSLSSRIVGGEAGEISEAPYMVSIRYKKNASAPYEHRCSGTIYSMNTILTTATCVIGLDTNRLHIKAGSTYRTQFDGFIYPVEKYIIHPDFNIWFFDNDVALIKLPFNLTAYQSKEISPLSVADELPATGQTSSIAGWGSTNAASNTDFSEELQVAMVSVVDQSQCRGVYGESRITEAMFCAGAEGTDACNGDAGGAMVYQGKAVGLVSWGLNCANAEYPGVYTNLVLFKSWIESEVAKL